MKEIGGYIELDDFHGSMLHEKAKHLNCGRNALAYLIESRNIKKIWLPYFLCDSVKAVCLKYGVEFFYYHIDTEFKVEEIDKRNDEWLYVVNYYGQLSDDYILYLKDKYQNIIVDNAQAYFSMPIKNIDTVYTCRKFFGVSDGAVLFTDSNINRKLDRDESFERIHYILGRYERTAGEFYQESSDNNAFFENEPLKLMSRLTENILHTVDYDFIKKRRTKNFMFLNERLAKSNMLTVSNVEGAFMYPLMIQHADEIRKKLIRKKIFIPVLWPDVFSVCDKNDLEYKFAEGILPLPVDQRYTEEDMLYVISEIKRM